MAEPIAVEESLDEGSLPESRNFICGVVEGSMENPVNPALFSPNKGTNTIKVDASTIPSSLHLFDNIKQHGIRNNNTDETQASNCVQVLKESRKLEKTNNKIEPHKEKQNNGSKILNNEGKPMMERKNKHKKNVVPVDLPNTCANPWKCKKLRTDIIEENIIKSECTFSQVLLLLNKLNNENFYPITKQFFRLDINDSNVDRIIQILFKKASAESIYVEEYADVILQIHEMVNVKNIMCNNESNVFVNKPDLKSTINLSINKGIEKTLENVTDNLIPKLKGAEITDTKRGYRDKLLNCLIFITALFKRGLIETKGVLDMSFYFLKEENSELILQSLAVFLIKNGEKIESTVNSVSKLQLNWNQLVELIEKAISINSFICKKTLFLLQDFIKLKCNKWIPLVIRNPEKQFSSAEMVKREKKRFQHIKDNDISLYYAKELQFMNVAQKPWKRGCFNCKEWLQEPCVLRKVQMILNVINGSNFEKCVNKFMQPRTFKSGTIDACVDIVLNQFIQDTKYNRIYIRLLKSCIKRDKKSKRKTSEVDSLVFGKLLVEKSVQMVVSNHTDSQKLTNICCVISELFNSNVMDSGIFFDLLSTLVCQEEKQKLIYLAKILFLCQKNIEYYGNKNGKHKVQWEEILEKIDSICSLNRDKISNYTLFMLSSVSKFRPIKWTNKNKESLSSSLATKSNLNITHSNISENHPRQTLRKEKEEKTTENHAHEEESLQTREQFFVKDILKDLDMVDNPWRRGEFKRDLTPSERTIMNAKTLLNKLTEKNFKSIVEQFTKLNFTAETVESILNVLFVKAVLETKFTELHAKFIKSVADLMGARNEQNTDDADFVFDLKTLILEMCVMEIDSINDGCSLITDEIYHLKLSSHDETENSNQDSDGRICKPIKTRMKNLRKPRKFLTEHYRELLKKKITVGTCHFLGELFNVDVVDIQFILTTLLCDLLPYETEESIECAIKLISVAGKKLERSLTRAADENYLAGWNLVLENIASKAAQENRERWSNRLYFMLLDLIDLRERDWLPRIIILPTRQFRAPKKARGF